MYFRMWKWGKNLFLVVTSHGFQADFLLKLSLNDRQLMLFMDPGVCMLISKLGPQLHSDYSLSLRIYLWTFPRLSFRNLSQKHSLRNQIPYLVLVSC